MNPKQKKKLKLGFKQKNESEWHWIFHYQGYLCDINGTIKVWNENYLTRFLYRNKSNNSQVKGQIKSSSLPLTSHVPNYFVKVECVCLKFENGQSSVLRVISLFYATEDLGFFFTN